MMEQDNLTDDQKNWLLKEKQNLRGEEYSQIIKDYKDDINKGDDEDD